MNGEVIIVDDVAGAFAECVRDAYHSRIDGDRFTIAFAGGSTARPCYERLAKEPIDWSAVTAVWGDERCVPSDHEDSNFALTKTALLDQVTPLSAVHPMSCDSDPQGAAAAYDQLIATLAPLDVVHLGMGNDGHTASLFPDSPALNVNDRFVVSTGDDLHTHERLTLTFPALNQARLVLFTVSGANKAEMFQRVRNGEDLPAGRVAAERVVWFVDRAADG